MHLPNPLAALAVFLSRPKGKVILFWHSDIINQKKTKFFFNTLQTWLLNRAESIVVTSAEYALGSTDLKPYLHKTVTIPLGVSKGEYEPPISVGRFENLGAERYVLCVGRLVAYKGFDLIIKAMDRIETGTKLIIVGNGPLLKELRSLCTRLQLESRVLFYQNVTDAELNYLFSNCFAFCLSSVNRAEAFGVVQLEAMSHGKPVISCKINGSGVSWVNKSGESGLAVEVGNSEDLSKAISLLERDSGLYARLCQGARKRYLELFTVEQMSENFKRLFKNKGSGRLASLNPVSTNCKNLTTPAELGPETEAVLPS